MQNKEIISFLEQLGVKPDYGTKDFEYWFTQENFLNFLINTTSDKIPVYLSFQNTFVYSVFLPTAALKNNYIPELLEWDCNATNSWSYGYSFSKKGKPKRISIYLPLDSERPALLSKATPITFLRSFEGRPENRSYVEINQLITHLHGLHYDEAVNAYCRLNDEGDIEQVLKIDYAKEKTLVTLEKDVIDFHSFLSKSVLIRFFDRMICNDWQKFSGWGNNSVTLHSKEKDVYFRRGEIRNDNMQASYIRGFQIIRNGCSRKAMLAMLEGKPLKPKKYETFIAHDWKHKEIRECSCDPKKLGNYFVKSDKPFETSPVFFKPEVLLKYKADPIKYSLHDRRISCRGAWSLETYDINEAGQVHTYLVYLGRLPHSEQLYWKSFNEHPKKGVSERALKTDFKGDWDLNYEPLRGLKQSLRELQQNWPELWECLNEQMFDGLNYPVTTSEKEWSDEVHNLDKLVVEGFKYPFLKVVAVELSCFNPKFQSIKLLETILRKKHISTNEIEGITSPLVEVHLLRTKFSGHRSGTEAQKIKRDLIKKHGDLNKHFRSLLTQLDEAIKTLIAMKF